MKSRKVAYSSSLELKNAQICRTGPRLRPPTRIEVFRSSVFVSIKCASLFTSMSVRALYGAQYELRTRSRTQGNRDRQTSNSPHPRHFLFYQRRTCLHRRLVSVTSSMEVHV